MESFPTWTLRPACFLGLGQAFYHALEPQPLPDPRWLGASPAAAAELGLPTDWADERWCAALAGSAPVPGTRPVATVYSGHQFGVWAGQLGDGRALLMGECDAGDVCWEVQLKGSGRTPYSRMGDGRAVWRSSIREFLASEAMHALGIPTTRALCVVGSPAPVWRETVEQAAVVTRLAPSFIRFGHFEHFASIGASGELRRLADFVIDQFYPRCRLPDGPADDETAWLAVTVGATGTGAPSPPIPSGDGAIPWTTDGCANPYARLLEAVTRRTARLLAAWQAVGFCHGVMNTDNMSILGLTLDYGPYQFMDTFDAGHICNASDHGGRYAYARQPQVAYWNLHCLAQALLPLLDDIDQARRALQPYREVFWQALQARMNAKLGLMPLPQHDRTDAERIEALLQLMQADRVDYPIFWRRLTDAAADGALSTDPTEAQRALLPVRALFVQRDAFERWAADWRQRARAATLDTALACMRAANPRVVLRNHLAQQVIEHAQAGDCSAVQRLLWALLRPFDEPDDPVLTATPPSWAAQLRISCSS
ncbi:protein adenylyltransferase SelO [Tepidimonas sp.]|uniref:protein adenylyltransferase SelO n=1 Tax=Tepidimonas sp. TaxID=2002775 RepID=UPI002FE0D05E